MLLKQWRSTSKKREGLILKLDMKKAFDRVDWNFLEKVLFLMGFSLKWPNGSMVAYETPNILSSLMVVLEPVSMLLEVLDKGIPFPPYFSF